MVNNHRLSHYTIDIYLHRIFIRRLFTIKVPVHLKIWLGSTMIAFNSCVKKDEHKTLAACLLYIFCLFFTWFLLRPVRDEMGIAGGVDNLAWLFSATLIVMLVCNPLFAWTISRWKRERFIAVSYRFFAVHLLVFWLMMQFPAQVLPIWTGRIFFVWVSVFNLFVVSTF